jgi:hypothetical protein
VVPVPGVNPCLCLLHSGSGISTTDDFGLHFWNSGRSYLERKLLTDGCIEPRLYGTDRLEQGNHGFTLKRLQVFLRVNRSALGVGAVGLSRPRSIGANEYRMYAIKRRESQTTGDSGRRLSLRTRRNNPSEFDKLALLLQPKANSARNNRPRVRKPALYR